MASPSRHRTSAAWPTARLRGCLGTASGDRPGSDAAAAYSWACAVTIGWLIEFTNDHDCWEWPTWRVVRDIVKPETAELRCRYADLPSVRATGAVGEATTFASHTWGAKWGGLVSALADGGADRSRRVWIDIFAIRQWPGNAADLAFGGVVSRCKSFVVVCQSALCARQRAGPERARRGVHERDVRAPDRPGAAGGAQADRHSRHGGGGGGGLVVRSEGARPRVARAAAGAAASALRRALPVDRAEARRDPPFPEIELDEDPRREGRRTPPRSSALHTPAADRLSARAAAASSRELPWRAATSHRATHRGSRAQHGRAERRGRAWGFQTAVRVERSTRMRPAGAAVATTRTTADRLRFEAGDVGLESERQRIPLSGSHPAAALRF